MIEKILERLEKLKEKHGCDTITCAECERRYGYDCARNESKITIDLCKEIVQEVEKEYGKDTNVRSKEYEKGKLDLSAEIMKYINSSNRNNADCFIVDQIEELCSKYVEQKGE